MYKEYFGFKEPPFSIAPDPRYLYMTAQHRDALAHLVYGLNSEGGCILLTGEVGTGKTTICRCLIEQIPEQANVALVLNPKVNEIELLETICDELKISYPDASNSIKTYTDRIYDFLINSNQRNEKTVLIIDEAQNLDSKVLEQLRLLTNLETNQRKLLQIVILGQPELLDILAKSEMRQLAQRITARFHLQPLTRQEVKAYISHRLAVAGQNIQLFPDNTISLLYRYSKGIPRLINVICDRALLGAYVENQYAVNTSILKKAATEVFGELKSVEKQNRFKKRLYPLAALSGLIIISMVTVLYVISSNDISAGNQQAKAPAINDTDIPADSTATTDTMEDSIPLEVTANDNPENIVRTAVAESIDSSVTDSSETVDLVEIQPEQQLPEPPPANDTAATYDDFNIILNDSTYHPSSAYMQLFEAWGLKYNTKLSSTACQQAISHGLNCLYKQGNINSLKAHNRPAVLTLTNDQGAKRYITITGIHDDLATVYSNNKEYTIRLADLDDYWYGNFILLWRKPDDYTLAVTPGDRGKIVSWLQGQLLTNEDNMPAKIVSTYDSYLIEKVKAFQLQQGLTADGIVGPVTIIHLNTRSGMKAPSLIPTTTLPKTESL